MILIVPYIYYVDRDAPEGEARRGTIHYAQRYKLFLIGARLELNWRMFGFGLDF